MNLLIEEMNMKKYHFAVITLLTLGIYACSSNPPVAVVKGDKNIDYSADKNIHISESTVGIQPTIIEK